MNSSEVCGNSTTETGPQGGLKAMLGFRGLSRASVCAAALSAILVASIAATSASAAERDFTQRFGENARGNVTMAANTLITCLQTVTNCEKFQDGTISAGNPGTPAFVDVDGDPTTKDSSRATLNLPPGAEVLFAGLYWGGRPELEPAGSGPNLTKAEFGEVKLAVPGGGYQDVSADAVDEVVFGTNTNATWQGFADVTAIVRSAGAGVYTVGGVRLEGVRRTSNGSWGGWSLAVAYRAPSEPWRNLVVYDGLKGVLSGGSTVDIPLSGFLTPPAPANVNTTFGVVAYEGDRGSSGDSMRTIQGADQVVLSDALTPANDFFNSTISREGTDSEDRSPAYANQMGIDAKLIDKTNALNNSTSSATVRISTSGDGVALGVITAATELFVPDLTLTKTVEDVTDPGAAIARPGDVLQYTITAENRAGTPTEPVDSAGSFVLSDAIPAGTTYVPGSLALAAGPNAPATPSDAAGDDVGEYDAGSDQVVFRLGSGADATSGGTLAPGATTTATFKVQIDNDFGGGPIDNQALADYRAVTLDRPLRETAEASLLSEPLSDLSIVKSASPAQVEVGDPLTYTLAVENHGPSTSDPTIVADTLPTGLSYVSDTAGCDTSALPLIECDLGAIASGASQSVEIVTEVEASAGGTFVENTAEVSGPNPETDTTNNRSTAKTPVVPFSDLSIEKTTSASSVKPGENLTYTLAVENAGVSTSNPTTVTDTLPAGLEYVSDDAGCDVSAPPKVECDVGSLAEGDTATIEIVAKVLATSGSVQNTAEVDGPNPDPEPDNDDSTASTPIDSVSDLRIEKSASAPSAQPGQQLTYTLKAENLGPSTSNPTTVTDTLPAELSYLSDDASCETIALPEIICSVGSLASGESKEVHLVVEVSPAATGTIENTASVGGPNFDPELANDEDSATTTVEEEADLAIHKTAGAAAAKPGEQLTYTLAVENKGPSASNPTTVTDTLPAQLTYVSDDAGCDTSALPAISCDLGELANGATKTIEIVTEVNAGASGEVENSARVSGPHPDPEPESDESKVKTPITPFAADLALEKTASTAGPVKAGETITYTLAATNHGPDPSPETVVADNLPSGLAYVSDDAGCDVLALPKVECHLGSLANGETRSVHVVATVAATGGGAIVNTAAVRGALADPVPPNNPDSAEITVASPPPAATTPPSSPPPASEAPRPPKPHKPKPKSKPGKPKPAKPKLVLEKIASTGFARPSAVVGYKITVWNRGTRAARKVKVCDEPPSGLSILRSTPAASGKRSPCWKLKRLAAGAKRIFRVTAQIAAGSHSVERNVATVRAANVKGVRSDSAGVRVKPLPETACGSRLMRSGAWNGFYSEVELLC